MFPGRAFVMDSTKDLNNSEHTLCLFEKDFYLFLYLQIFIYLCFYFIESFEGFFLLKCLGSVSFLLFFTEINTFIHQACIKLIKFHSKDIYNVSISNKSFEVSLIKESCEKCITVSTKTLIIRNVPWGPNLLLIQLCHHRNKLHFNILKQKTVILNCNNISQYLHKCFTNITTSYRPKPLNDSIYTTHNRNVTVNSNIYLYLFCFLLKPFNTWKNACKPHFMIKLWKHSGVKCLKLNRNLTDILPSSKRNNSSQQAHNQGSLGMGIGNRVLGRKQLKMHLPAFSLFATLVSYSDCSKQQTVFETCLAFSPADHDNVRQNEKSFQRWSKLLHFDQRLERQ